MTMNIRTSKTCFTLKDNETLLEGLERTGHTIEYQCREGYCGSCRTTITSGSVKYNTHPLAYLRANEILPCCSVPSTPISIITN